MLAMLKDGYIAQWICDGETLPGGVKTSEPADEEDFLANFAAYKVVDGVLVRDDDAVATLDRQRALDDLRRRREEECFAIVNRGKVWYDTLTAEQMAQLTTWYKAWLDAPETGVAPETPAFVLAAQETS